MCTYWGWGIPGMPEVHQGAHRPGWDYSHMTGSCKGRKGFIGKGLLYYHKDFGISLHETGKRNDKLWLVLWKKISNVLRLVLQKPGQKQGEHLENSSNGPDLVGYSDRLSLSGSCHVGKSDEVSLFQKQAWQESSMDWMWIVIKKNSRYSWVSLRFL